MAGHHPRRPHAAQVRNHLEPALQAAVDHRQPVDEHQVAGEQGSGAEVQDSQVVVGVCGPPRGQHQHPVAEIDTGLVGDLDGRNDDARAFERRTDETFECVEVERTPDRHRAGEPAMSRKRDAVFVERHVSEEVVGMRVGGDHPGDAAVGDRRDARAQPPAELGAAAGVDDRDGIAPDHHTRVSDGAEVPGAGLLVRTRVDMDSCGHFLESKRFHGPGRYAKHDGGRERQPSVRSGGAPDRWRSAAPLDAGAAGSGAAARGRQG